MNFTYFIEEYHSTKASLLWKGDKSSAKTPEIIYKEFLVKI